MTLEGAGPRRRGPHDGLWPATACGLRRLPGQRPRHVGGNAAAAPARAGTAVGVMRYADCEIGMLSGGRLRNRKLPGGRPVLDGRTPWWPRSAFRARILSGPPRGNHPDHRIGRNMVPGRGVWIYVSGE